MLKNEYLSCFLFKTRLNHQSYFNLLTIPNGEIEHYVEIKKLSAFLIGTPSKSYGFLCCWDLLHSFRTKSKPKKFN